MHSTQVLLFTSTMKQPNIWNTSDEFPRWDLSPRPSAGGSHEDVYSVGLGEDWDTRSTVSALSPPP